MRSRRALSPCFLARLPASLRATLAPEVLEPVLTSLLAAARGAWPTCVLSEERFLAYLASKLPPEGEVLRALEELQVADLYLACACADGDESALAAFEKSYGPAIDLALARLRLPASQADEVKQVLRQDFFVGEGEHGASIQSYAGRGPLRGWVQIVAARQALKLLRRDKRTQPLDDRALQAIPSLADDPEMLHMKGAFRPAFKRAFREALATLSPRALNLLRQHFIDGLSTTQIGALYGAHQTTAARWLRQAQEQLHEETRRRLLEQLHLKPAELESIMKLVRSQLDITLRTFMGRESGEP